MSRFLHPQLAGFQPYVPGEQPETGKPIKLNTNELPFPPSPEVVDAVRECAGQIELYPDPDVRALRSAVAAYFGLSPQNVLATNGSDEALAFTFQTLCPDGALFPDVTYGFYKIFAGLYGVPVSTVELADDFTVPIGELAREKGTIFLANPNAPSGLAVPDSAIEELLLSDKNRLVVVDEAYVAFSGRKSAAGLIAKHDNLLVIGTFSKAWGLAGARLGFALANEEIIADLGRTRFSFNPYSVTSAAQAAGVAALASDAYYADCRQKVIGTRQRVLRELRALGFDCPESRTNFLFPSHPACDAQTIFRKLRADNILVRWFDTSRTANRLRITVGTDAEMDALLASLDWLKGQGNP